MSLFLLVLSGFSIASDSVSEFIYDLSLNGEKVGFRSVKVEYLPIDEVNPRGGRKLTIWTELSTQFAGQELNYKQRASSLNRPQKPKKFISSSSINGELLEIQGRQKRNGQWIISIISPQEVITKTLESHQLHGSTLDLFDPDQLNRWQPKQRNILMVVETDLNPISGKWVLHHGSPQSDNDPIGIEKSLDFRSEIGALTLNWSHDGAVLSWNVSKGPLTLKATLRSLPQKPNFGEIDAIEIGNDVQEEEL